VVDAVNSGVKVYRVCVSVRSKLANDVVLYGEKEESSRVRDSARGPS